MTKNVNTALLIIVLVSWLAGFWFYTKKNKEIETLSRENGELRILNDSTISAVVGALALSDSIAGENKRIQEGKDSLQLYFNVLEERYKKKEKEYEKLVNDTANIRELFDYLSKHLFTD